MKTIALTGGGTAGHIMPNLALVGELKKHFDRIIYIGAGGMEEEMAKAAGLPFFKTQVVKLERTAVWKNFKIPFVLSKAVREAEEILKAEKVDCVFGKGGYVALPTAFAARKRKIPLVIHESDVSMGVANRLLSRFSSGIITSFPETKGGDFIGNPVRSEVMFGNPNSVVLELKLQNKPTVLVVGGSLGAEVFNKTVWENVKKLTARYNIIHIAGKGYDKNITAGGYHQFPLTDRLPDFYAAADVVVTRAGANTLAELAALGKRTIAIPLPKGASRGDQIENARSYEKRGLVVVLPQEELKLDSLLKTIQTSLESDAPKAVAPRAVNKNIVSYIIDAMKNS